MVYLDDNAFMDALLCQGDGRLRGRWEGTYKFDTVIIAVFSRKTDVVIIGGPYTKNSPEIIGEWGRRVDVMTLMLDEYWTAGMIVNVGLGEIHKLLRGRAQWMETR